MKWRDYVDLRNSDRDLDRKVDEKMRELVENRLALIEAQVRVLNARAALEEQRTS